MEVLGSTEEHFLCQNINIYKIIYKYLYICIFWSIPKMIGICEMLVSVSFRAKFSTLDRKIVQLYVSQFAQHLKDSLKISKHVKWGKSYWVGKSQIQIWNYYTNSYGQVKVFKRLNVIRLVVIMYTNAWSEERFISTSNSSNIISKKDCSLF